MLEGEDMNRSKLIAILLFLLLLLMILCAWCHSGDIAENRVKSQTPTSNVVTPVIAQKSIDFHLKKDKDSLELSGNFSDKENVAKLQKALNSPSLNDLSKVNETRVPNPEVIALCEELMPLFETKYTQGSISYQNEQLNIEGSVSSESDKEAINTLLSNSTVKSVNHTKVHFIPTEPIKFKIDKQNGLLALQGIFQASHEAQGLVDALNNTDLKERIEVNEALIPNEHILLLTQELIKPFNTHYKNGFIKYENKVLTLNGTLESKEIATEIEALLEASGLDYVNQTLVVETKEIVDIKPNPLPVITKEEAKVIEVQIQKIIDFENINFEVNKATISEKSHTTIENIATVLKKNTAVHVEIAGHTDNTGNETHNLTLSQKRVDSVKQQLVNSGVDASRLKAIGYGQTEPLVSNDTQENRRLNRRVEFKVIGE